MKILLGTIAAGAALALPAFAQDAATDYSTVTCADFSAMDQAGMMSAYQGMTAAMASDGMAAGDATATTDTATTDMASTDTASTDTATTDTASADAGGDMAMDPMMTALVDACAADPSMMAMDAMTAAQGSMGTESSGG